MTINAKTPLFEVAMAVCSALERAGITAVLTGGSAATYYAPEAYQSSDIDFVAVRFGNTRAREAVEHQLGAIGFRVDQDCYRHPESPYPIEFPPGPLAVGRELLTGWRTVQSAEGILHVLHPTDSVKDRLAAFIHWNDRSGLSQALAVAKAIPDEIDLASLEAWAEGENGRAKFEEFRERFNRG
ncbi:MAG TPA: hypothetical protein V6D00_08010 [Pantanalinema sp.]